MNNIFVNIFAIIILLAYEAITIRENCKVKKYFPKLLELLMIFFYIFYAVAFFLAVKNIKDFILSPKIAEINQPIFVFLGIIFCLASIILFSYLSFFEKSFPSCMAIQNKKELKGIYKYIRHPSYYVFFFFTFGIAFCLQSFWLLVLAMANHILMYFYYMIEESQAKNNEYYASYLKKTNRFFPKF